MFVNWNKVRSALDVQGGSCWYVTKVKPLTKKEKRGIISTAVVKSKYGLAMAFYMTTGKFAYIPISTNSHYQVGDCPPVDELMVITLHKFGEKCPIYRVDKIDPSYMNVCYKKKLLSPWLRRNIGRHIYHKLCIPLKKLDCKLHGKKYSIFEDLYLY